MIHMTYIIGTITLEQWDNIYITITLEQLYMLYIIIVDSRPLVFNKVEN